MFLLGSLLPGLALAHLATLDGSMGPLNEGRVERMGLKPMGLLPWGSGV